MWVPTFDWGPRCGSLILGMVAIARSLLRITQFLESLKYSDLVRQMFYHSRGSHSLDRCSGGVLIEWGKPFI